MQRDGVTHQAEPRIVHAIEEARQIQPAQHPRSEREDSRFVIHFLLRITPIALLFRQNRQARAGGDRRVNQRIALVGGGLQIKALQLRVIGTHRTGTAVFDHDVRMTATQVVQPIQVGAAVAEQASAGGFGIEISADAGDGVVVEFEEDRAEIVNQPVDGTSDVLACGGRAEVEQVAARIAYTHTVALEERVIGQTLGERRFHADYFRFEPQSQTHAVRADGVGQALQTGVAEAVRGRLPFADHVPPAAVRAVIPSGIDAENVRADAGRALDKR